MNLRIDETKYQPEKIFDNNGLVVYKYTKPLFVYATKDNEVKKLTATRVVRENYAPYLYKTQYEYRGLFSPLLMKQINDSIHIQIGLSNLSQNIERNYFRTGYDSISFYNDYTKFVIKAIQELTGYEINPCFFKWPFDIEFVNSSIITSREDMKRTLGWVSFDDLSKITTQTKKELAIEQENKRKQLLEQLFGPNIEALAEKYDMLIPTYASDRHQFIYFKSDSGVDKIKKMVEKYLKDTILKELNDIGLDAEINPKFFEGLPVSYSPIIQNIRIKEENL